MDKNLSIYLIIANIVLKKYFIYYLDIISIIYFLIDHCFFIVHMVYKLIQCYSIDNSKNLKIIDKNEQIFRKIHIID